MSSFCPSCGTGTTEGELFCGNCGREFSSERSVIPALDPVVAFGLPPERSGKAIFSLICGIAFFALPLLLALAAPATKPGQTFYALVGVVGILAVPIAIVAIIFGHLSRSDIRKSAGRLAGKGLALSGLILAYTGLSAAVVLLVIGAIAVQRARKSMLAGQVTTNQPSAVSALRTLNTAEIAYAQAHPAEGYTCSLDDLSDSWGIDDDLAQVKKNGYVLEMQGCATAKTNGPVTKYQVVAYPARSNKARLPAFCSNQSDVIKIDWSGSPQNCLSKGSDLPAAQINHPQGWTPAAPR